MRKVVFAIVGAAIYGFFCQPTVDRFIAYALGIFTGWLLFG